MSCQGAHSAGARSCGGAVVGLFDLGGGDGQAGFVDGAGRIGGGDGVVVAVVAILNGETVHFQDRVAGAQRMLAGKHLTGGDGVACLCARDQHGR